MKNAEEQAKWFSWVSPLCWNRLDWFKLHSLIKTSQESHSFSYSDITCNDLKKTPNQFKYCIVEWFAVSKRSNRIANHLIQIVTSKHIFQIIWIRSEMRNDDIFTLNCEKDLGLFPKLEKVNCLFLSNNWLFFSQFTFFIFLFHARN